MPFEDTRAPTHQDSLLAHVIRFHASCHDSSHTGNETLTGPKCSNTVEKLHSLVSNDVSLSGLQRVGNSHTRFFSHSVRLFHVLHRAESAPLASSKSPPQSPITIQDSPLQLLSNPHKLWSLARFMAVRLYKSEEVMGNRQSHEYIHSGEIVEI